MGNCLVTKLKSVVDNDMLVHLGNEQLVIDDWVNWSGGVTAGEEGVTFVIKSNHEFTDSTYQQHLGKTKTSSPNERFVMRFLGLDGETGPVVVELGPKSNIKSLEGYYPINDDSYGYVNLTTVSCTVNAAVVNLPKLLPKTQLLSPQTMGGGVKNVSDFIPWDSLVRISNVLIDGKFEDICVGKYNRPQSEQRVGSMRFFVIVGVSTVNSPTFNGVKYPGQDLRALYSDASPYITVYTKFATAEQQTLGTWDGTSWTYTD